MHRNKIALKTCVVDAHVCSQLFFQELFKIEKICLCKLVMTFLSLVLGRIGIGVVPFKIFTARLGLSVLISYVHFKKNQFH